MRIRSLRQVKNLSGRRVFLRVDFNVPVVKGKIMEDYKIASGLESIKLLTKAGAKLIVATHLGDPKRKSQAYSTRPLALRLKKLLKQPVIFCPAVSGPLLAKAASRLKPGQILFIENIRFHPGEKANDEAFARELASLADIYVNDAFAVSHRPQASVGAIKGFLPAYAGLLLEAEVKAFAKALKPQPPLVVVMGGAKISTKAPLISRLLSRASHILIGGALANNFFKYSGRQIGRSLYDSDSAQFIKPFFTRGRLNPKLLLPVDVVVSSARGPRLKSPGSVKRNESIMDIGPATISLFAEKIKAAATLVWNGPLGKFEEPSFRQGTLSIARLIASRAGGPAFGLVGGGETVAALKLTKMEEYVDWVSTAGGAGLAYLGGEPMPGLEGIIKE